MVKLSLVNEPIWKKWPLSTSIANYYINQAPWDCAKRKISTTHPGSRPLKEGEFLRDGH